MHFHYPFWISKYNYCSIFIKNEMSIELSSKKGYDIKV